RRHSGADGYRPRSGSERVIIGAYLFPKGWLTSSPLVSSARFPCLDIRSRNRSPPCGEPEQLRGRTRKSGGDRCSVVSPFWHVRSSRLPDDEPETGHTPADPFHPSVSVTACLTSSSPAAPATSARTPFGPSWRP